MIQPCSAHDRHSSPPCPSKYALADVASPALAILAATGSPAFSYHSAKASHSKPFAHLQCNRRCSSSRNGCGACRSLIVPPKIGRGGSSIFAVFVVAESDAVAFLGQFGAKLADLSGGSRVESSYVASSASRGFERAFFKVDEHVPRLCL